MISIIAAIGKKRELGYNNSLLWHLKDDMKYFRETTNGHTVVMGRKTFESIEKPLTNRRNIVITRSTIDGVETTSDIGYILNIAKEENVFIIGGSSIYEMFLPYANKLYLTLIDDDKEADVFFPEFDEKEYKKELIEKKEENNIKYSFVIYEKINYII